MKNLKFKRYNVGYSFEPTTAETDTIHLFTNAWNKI